MRIIEANRSTGGALMGQVRAMLDRYAGPNLGVDAIPKEQYGNFLNELDQLRANAGGAR